MLPKTPLVITTILAVYSLVALEVVLEVLIPLVILLVLPWMPTLARFGSARMAFGKTQVIQLMEPIQQQHFLGLLSDLPPLSSTAVIIWMKHSMKLIARTLLHLDSII